MKTKQTLKNLLFSGIISLTLASCGGGGGGGGGSSSGNGGHNGNNSSNNQAMVLAPETLTGGMTFEMTPYDGDEPETFSITSPTTFNDEGGYEYSMTYVQKSDKIGEISYTYSGVVTYGRTFVFTGVNQGEYYMGTSASPAGTFKLTGYTPEPGENGGDINSGSSDNDVDTVSSPESLAQKILTIKDSPVLESGESFVFLSDTSALYGGQIKATYSYTKDANIRNKGFLESTINYGGYTYIHKFTITFLSDTEVTISGTYNVGSDTRYYTDNAGTLTTGNSSPDSSGGESNDSSSDNTGNDTEESRVGTAPDSLKGYVIHAQSYSGATRYYITGDDEAYIKASYRNEMTGYYSGEQYIFSDRLSYIPSEDRKTAKLYISTPSQWIGSTYPYGGQMAGYQQKSTSLSATLYFDDEGNIYHMEGTLDYKTLNSSESIGVNTAQ